MIDGLCRLRGDDFCLLSVVSFSECEDEGK